MLYTSSEANKLLKKLNSDYKALSGRENESNTFVAATGEDPETVRPEYDYESTTKELAELGRKIRLVKHAINVFNTTTKVEDFDMTVDEMLVMLPQLSARVLANDMMRKRLPKVRVKTYGSGMGATIDYRYVNYDLNKVEEDYQKLYDKLAKAQTALDIVNNTIKFEIDI